MNPTQTFVDVDSSRAHLDVPLRPQGIVAREPNSSDGIAAVIRRIEPVAPALVVVEATGGLEAQLVVELAEAGIPVAVVNPR